MKYFNLKVVILLKEEINSINAYEKISKLISKSMLADEYLKSIHEKNQYKNYVFCNLYPVEKDGIYKSGRIYSFDIRFTQYPFAMKIKQVLEKTEDETFKVITIRLQTNEQRKINTLKTLTPAIITTPKGDYAIKEDLELVKQRILANTQKKYNQIYNQKIEFDFIKEITKTNNIPIKIPYKNINLLGNKFEIEIKEDPISQNFAYLILSVGLLEKNAEGFGFCKAK